VHGSKVPDELKTRFDAGGTQCSYVALDELQYIGDLELFKEQVFKFVEHPMIPLQRKSFVTGEKSLVVRLVKWSARRGGMSTPFFMSINEIRFSELHSEHYVLYRLFEFKIDSGSAKLFKVGGNIRNACQFEAINFRVRI
jgi:hypothetical protein